MFQHSYKSVDSHIATGICISKIKISSICDGLGFISDLINDNYLLHILFNLFCVNLCAKVFLSPLFL